MAFLSRASREDKDYRYGSLLIDLNLNLYFIEYYDIDGELAIGTATFELLDIDAE